MRKVCKILLPIAYIFLAAAIVVFCVAQPTVAAHLCTMAKQIKGLLLSSKTIDRLILAGITAFVILVMILKTVLRRKGKNTYWANIIVVISLEATIAFCIKDFIKDLINTKDALTIVSLALFAVHILISLFAAIFADKKTDSKPILYRKQGPLLYVIAIAALIAFIVVPFLFKNGFGVYGILIKNVYRYAFDFNKTWSGEAARNVMIVVAGFVTAIFLLLISLKRKRNLLPPLYVVAGTIGLIVFYANKPYMGKVFKRFVSKPEFIHSAVAFGFFIVAIVAATAIIYAAIESIAQAFDKDAVGSTIYINKEQANEVKNLIASLDEEEDDEEETEEDKEVKPVVKSSVDEDDVDALDEEEEEDEDEEEDEEVKPTPAKPTPVVKASDDEDDEDEDDDEYDEFADDEDDELEEEDDDDDDDYIVDDDDDDDEEEEEDDDNDSRELLRRRREEIRKRILAARANADEDEEDDEIVEEEVVEEEIVEEEVVEEEIVEEEVIEEEVVEDDEDYEEDDEDYDDEDDIDSDVYEESVMYDDEIEEEDDEDYDDEDYDDEDEDDEEEDEESSEDLESSSSVSLPKFNSIKSKPLNEKLFTVLDDEKRERYNIIRNALQSYKKVRERLSSKGDSYRYHGDLIAKMTISGKTLRLHLALNPSDFENTKYSYQDLSAKSKFIYVPMTIKLTSKRSVKYALELIDMLAQTFDLIKNPKYVEQDYIQELQDKLQNNL